MIEKLIEFSAKNKYIVLVLTLMAILIAIYSVKNISLDAIPDLSDTQVIIYSRWDRSPRSSSTRAAVAVRRRVPAARSSG